jgi:hypothetical protein
MEYVNHGNLKEFMKVLQNIDKDINRLLLESESKRPSYYRLDDSCSHILIELKFLRFVS